MRDKRPPEVQQNTGGRGDSQQKSSSKEEKSAFKFPTISEDNDQDF